MPYSLRRTWPDNPDSTDDYEFRWNGISVGRTYKDIFARDVRWLWTIYIKGEVYEVQDVPITGLELSLDDAKARFKDSFERMIKAGAVKLRGHTDHEAGL